MEKATMSPEPLVRTGYATSLPSSSGRTQPGRNARRGPRFRRLASSVAAISARRGSLAPSRRAMAVRTNNSKVTMVETGFPGSPNTSVPSSERPNTRGFPGLSATASNRRRTPSASRTFSTRSNRPIETPPDNNNKSSPSPFLMSFSSDASSSLATPRWLAEAPACRH